MLGSGLLEMNDYKNYGVQGQTHGQVGQRLTALGRETAGLIGGDIGRDGQENSIFTPN
jgi:hypothetical protein